MLDGSWGWGWKRVGSQQGLISLTGQSLGSDDAVRSNPTSESPQDKQGGSHAEKPESTAIIMSQLWFALVVKIMCMEPCGVGLGRLCNPGQVTSFLCASLPSSGNRDYNNYLVELRGQHPGLELLLLILRLVSLSAQSLGKPFSQGESPLFRNTARFTQLSSCMKPSWIPSQGRPDTFLTIELPSLSSSSLRCSPS